MHIDSTLSLAHLQGPISRTDLASSQHSRIHPKKYSDPIGIE